MFSRFRAAGTAVSVLSLAVAIAHSGPALGQSRSERFWLAGRYDGNRIIVYFDAVKFGGTAPPNAVKINSPVADGFLGPVALPAGYVNRFQKGSGAERFAIGDRYDLLLGGDDVATFTVTTLVGFEGDEETGNDSYIGALGTVDRDTGLLFERDYYAVRRHRESERTPRTKPNSTLFREPVRLDIQVQIAALMNGRMKTQIDGSARQKIEKLSPALEIQSFTVANGNRRYYARCEWRSGAESNNRPSYVLGAWISPLPHLRILAVEQSTSPYGFEDQLPLLRNVVDLGDGRSGLIVSIAGEDSRSLQLLEYHDGADLKHMRTLQSIGAGE